MIRRSADQRRRVDGLRARFERTTRPATANLDGSLDALEAAMERHFAASDASRITADRLIAALDVVPQGIVLADESGRIVFRNRTATEFLDARHGDALVGSLITELIAQAVNGVTATRTIELFGPPSRSLQVRSVPIELSGDNDRVDRVAVQGAYVVVEDVSERQWIEAVRRDFVANISHELKTPVAAMGLLAETLVDETDPEVSARLTKRIFEEAFRLSRTVDDLMQLSQIEAGSPVVQTEVAVSALLSEVAERTGVAAELGGVTVTAAQVPADLCVMGDRRQLVSAVSNLADNAIKYSDRDGSVALDARREGAVVVIEVQDQGIGIPARDLERIFERFYRVDRARSRDTGGTGLGLAIVRHVANNHGGSISVASREGEGSTFSFRLPAPGSDPDRSEEEA